MALWEQIRAEIGRLHRATDLVEFQPIMLSSAGPGRWTLVSSCGTALLPQKLCEEDLLTALRQIPRPENEVEVREDLEGIPGILPDIATPADLERMGKTGLSQRLRGAQKQGMRNLPLKIGGGS